jgi:PhzF family phenazine biosynthesis protein
MSEITVYKVNAFTNNGEGGNGAGVVLDADSLTSEQMQETARLVGYSETAFTQRISDIRFRFRFFSPTDEVDLCGHGTVAACSTLLQCQPPQILNMLCLLNEAGSVSCRTHL